MVPMLSRLDTTRRNAGAEEGDAREAAAAVAGYQNRFSRLESEVRLLRWMLGFNLALSVAILVKLFL
jgi:hypothetical protein